MTKRTITEHLKQINQNAKANSDNIDSLVYRLSNKGNERYGRYFKKAGYPICGGRADIIKEFVEMIFETQDNHCSMYVPTKEGQIGTHWHRPGKAWYQDQLKYEIDHVEPTNAGGKDSLENIQFLSPNANQFLKNSLTCDLFFRCVHISDVTKQRFKQVLENRKKLFKSKKWKDFIHKCEKIEGRA